MTIRIGGTTVVGNDRGLYNITSADTETKNTFKDRIADTNLSEWVSRKGSRNSGTSYQNNDGKVRHIFILVDYNAGQKSRIEVSSNNSSWFTLYETEGVQQSHSGSIPDGWYYRFYAGKPIITWIEGT